MWSTDQRYVFCKSGPPFMCTAARKCCAELQTSFRSHNFTIDGIRHLALVITFIPHLCRVRPQQSNTSGWIHRSTPCRLHGPPANSRPPVCFLSALMNTPLFELPLSGPVQNRRHTGSIYCVCAPCSHGYAVKSQDSVS